MVYATNTYYLKGRNLCVKKFPRKKISRIENCVIRGRNSRETSVLFVFRRRNFRELVPNSQKFLDAKISSLKVVASRTYYLKCTNFPEDK